MAAVILLPLPGCISLYWHLHVADEQEAAAYSRGALLGIYVFWIGAPVWWLLWRGGLRRRRLTASSSTSRPIVVAGIGLADGRNIAEPQLIGFVTKEEFL